MTNEWMKRMTLASKVWLLNSMKKIQNSKTTAKSESFAFIVSKRIMINKAAENYILNFIQKEKIKKMILK